MEGSGRESHWPRGIQATNEVVWGGCPTSSDVSFLIYVTVAAIASTRVVSGTDELMYSKQQEKCPAVSVASAWLFKCL